MKHLLNNKIKFINKILRKILWNFIIKIIEYMNKLKSGENNNNEKNINKWSY